MDRKTKTAAVGILAILACASTMVRAANPNIHDPGGGGGGGGGNPPIDREFPIFVFADPGRSETFTVDAGEAWEEIWTPGLGKPTGVVPATSTTLNRNRTHYFAVDGSELHVLNFTTGFVNRTVDVAAIVSIPNLKLAKGSSGRPMSVSKVVNGNTVNVMSSSLYLVGNAGSTGYFVVLDQDSLIDTNVAPADALLGYGPLCPDSETCTNWAIDIDVDRTVDSGLQVEEAFVTSVDSQYGYLFQNGYRIHRDFATWTSAYHVERRAMELWTGPDPASSTNIGLDFAAGVKVSDSGEAYAVLVSSKRIQQLNGSNLSCVLPGTPTDVSIWNTGSQDLLFVSYSAAGKGYVDAIQTDCSSQGPGLSVIVGLEPSSLAIQSADVVGDPDSGVFWVYTTHPTTGKIEGFDFELDQGVLVNNNSVELDLTYSGYWPFAGAIHVEAAYSLRDPGGSPLLNCLPGSPRCP